MCNHSQLLKNPKFKLLFKKNDVRMTARLQKTDADDENIEMCVATIRVSDKFKTAKKFNGDAK